MLSRPSRSYFQSKKKQSTQPGTGAVSKRASGRVPTYSNARQGCYIKPMKLRCQNPLFYKLTAEISGYKLSLVGGVGKFGNSERAVHIDPELFTGKRLN